MKNSYRIVALLIFFILEWQQVILGCGWRLDVLYKDVKHGECYFFHQPFGDKYVVYFFKDFTDTEDSIKEKYKITDNLLVNVDECTKPLE